ncbi:MAG: pentapeptide repeat-containing protein [Acidimicrobiales bacterium]
MEVTRALPPGSKACAHRTSFLVAVILAGGLVLSACGGSSNASSQLHSSDCKVSATNPNLAGCDLSGKNLSGVDLQSDNLRGANLTNTNLDNANIQGAKLKGANIKGALTNKFTVCVNAEMGPCSESGLRSPRTSDAAQGH